MACACKVNQQLSYIQRKYGIDGPKQKTGKVFNTWIILTNIFNAIAAMLLIPFMLISILFRGKKTINISKIFGLSSK